MYKKGILIVLVMVMVLGVSGCAGNGNDDRQASTDGTTGQTPTSTKPTGPQKFIVKVKNVHATQPLSPAVFAVHKGSVNMNFAGKTATSELETLAEWGDHSMLKDAVSKMDGVLNVYTIDSPIAPGGEASFEMEVPSDDYGVMLSGYAMAVKSNDGFAFVDAVQLYDAVGKSVTSTTNAINYDAGTEENTELGSGFAGGQPDSTRGEENKNNGTPTSTQGMVTTHQQLKEPVMQLMVSPM